MKTYYLKPPAKGSTTAYLCHQVYDSAVRRTRQTLVASFNSGADPVSPIVNVTDRGLSMSYKLSQEHLVEVQKWLRKHGTNGKTKVPARVLAQLRADIERQVRAELNAPAVGVPVVVAAKKAAPVSIADKFRAMCVATADAQAHLAGIDEGGLKVLRLSDEDLFELTIHFNFTEKALRKMLKSRGLSAKDRAVTVLPAEAAEARRRGILTDGAAE